MSYIDTFDHEYVADFAGLPLYHPTVDVDDAGGADFGCSPSNLVLGGGGGEHPGLVFHRLDCLAVQFVLHAIPETEEQQTIHEQFKDFPVFDYLDVNYSSIFEHAGWSVRDYYSFYQRCSSVALNFPYDDQDHFSFEEWLAVSIGELVWFSLPELIKNLEPVRRLYPDLRPFTWNVSMPPSGYPSKYGRAIIEGELVWGNSRFDTRVD